MLFENNISQNFTIISKKTVYAPKETHLQSTPFLRKAPIFFLNAGLSRYYSENMTVFDVLA